MPSMPPIGVVWHGGRLREAIAAFPHAPTPWLDLSTGINPESWTGERAAWADLTRLPDPRDLADLEAVAGLAFGVADARRVVATAGAEAGLRLLPSLIEAMEVAVVSPTYSSHAAAWRLAGRQVSVVAPVAVSGSKDAVLVVVNPNNPDGRSIDRADLLDLAEARSRRGLWTVVDESFVEVAPLLSVAANDIERLVVLRSFGKFHGLPGVRLGFIVASPVATERLRALQGDWPISADALTIGRAAYADEPWRARTRDRLDDAARALDALLTAHGLKVIGGTSLFRLVSTPRADGVFRELCQQGILTRPFEAAPEHLRIGLPGANGFDRFAAALEGLS